MCVPCAAKKNIIGRPRFFPRPADSCVSLAATAAAHRAQTLRRSLTRSTGRRGTSLSAGASSRPRETARAVAARRRRARIALRGVACCCCRRRTRATRVFFPFFLLAATRRLQQLWLVRDARDEALYLLLPRAGSHPLLQERLKRRKERSSSAGRARSPAHFRPLGASPPPSAPRHPLPHIVHVPPLARHAARRPRSAPRSLSHAGVSLNKLAKPLPLTVAVKE